jgi:NADH dehydrogenase/NADH:ubiquinone oxidoreductase subunit G
MAEHIELTIDGRAVAVEPGTTILEAARRVGITIPVLCYSPRTTVCAACVSSRSKGRAVWSPRA